MHLVRFIKVVRVLQVCHDHCMLGRFEKKGWFEGNNEE